MARARDMAERRSRTPLQRAVIQAELECMGVASGRPTVIVKERALGPVFESPSDVRSISCRAS